MTKPVLVCLHGWGGSMESFTELRAALEGVDMEILTPDLPGFGKEKEPNVPWTVDDYAKWVETWVEKHASHTPILLLGHSHGGRVAIKIAVRGKLELKHLYLCAAAGIRHPQRVRRVLGFSLAKIGRLFLSFPGLEKVASSGKKFLYRLFRVHDYENATPVMRETMIKISQEDLRPILSAISVPTDIFWGTEDHMTPVSDAKIMHDSIGGSQLHLFPGVRHRIHRERETDIAAVIAAQSQIS